MYLFANVKHTFVFFRHKERGDHYYQVQHNTIIKMILKAKVGGEMWGGVWIYCSYSLPGVVEHDTVPNGHLKDGGGGLCVSFHKKKENDVSKKRGYVNNFSSSHVFCFL